MQIVPDVRRKLVQEGTSNTTWSLDYPFPIHPSFSSTIVVQRINLSDPSLLIYSIDVV